MTARQNVKKWATIVRQLFPIKDSERSEIASFLLERMSAAEAKAVMHSVKLRWPARFTANPGDRLWVVSGYTKAGQYHALQIAATSKARALAQARAQNRNVTDKSERVASWTAKLKNPSAFFSAETEKAAKRVTKIRRVRQKDGGQEGEITGVLKGGWLKVKWDNRDKPTLIKRSEIVAVRANPARTNREFTDPAGVYRIETLNTKDKNAQWHFVKGVDGKALEFSSNEAALRAARKIRKTRKQYETRVFLFPYSIRSSARVRNSGAESPRGYGGAATRSNPNATYSVRAVKLAGGDYRESSDSEATTFGVYKAGPDGLSHHVRDFKTRKAAERFAEKKQAHNPSKRSEDIVRREYHRGRNMPSQCDSCGQYLKEGDPIIIDLLAHNAWHVNHYDKRENLFEKVQRQTRQSKNPSAYDQDVAKIESAIRKVIAWAKRDRTSGMGAANIKQLLFSRGGLRSSDLQISPGYVFNQAFNEALARVHVKGFQILDKARNPKRTTLKEVNEAGTDYTNAVKNWGEHNLVTQRAFQKYYELKEKYQRERGRDLHKTPHASNPRISKKRYFASFAGQYHESFAPYFTANRGRHTQMLKKGYEFIKAVKYPSESEPSTNVYTKDGATVHLSNKGKITLNYPVTHSKPFKNPSVTELAETFQGKANGAISEYKAASSAPADLARIGKLIFLKLCDVPRQIRAAGAMVAVDTRGRLWVVGKQSLFTPKARTPGEALDYGEIDKICYETAKAHIGNGELTEYVHTFGEDGGKRPRLLIDSDGMPILRGGDYEIKAEGIVN